jgi:hypothetical protein
MKKKIESNEVVVLKSYVKYNGKPSSSKPDNLNILGFDSIDLSGTYSFGYSVRADGFRDTSSASGNAAVLPYIIYMNGSTDYIESYVYMSGAALGAGSSSSTFQACLVRSA